LPPSALLPKRSGPHPYTRLDSPPSAPQRINPQTTENHPQKTTAGPAAAASPDATVAPTPNNKGRALLQGGPPPWARDRGGRNGRDGNNDREGDNNGGNDAFSGRVIVPGQASGGGDNNDRPFGGRNNAAGAFGDRNDRRPTVFPSAGGFGDNGRGNNDNNIRPMTRPFATPGVAFGPRPLGGGDVFGDRAGAPPVRVIGGGGNDRNGRDNNNNFFAADRPGNNRPPTRINNGGGGFVNNDRRDNDNRRDNDRRDNDRRRDNDNNDRRGNGNGNRGNGNGGSGEWNGPPGLRPFRLDNLEIRPEALQRGVPRTTGLARPNINRSGGTYNPMRDRVYRGFGGVGDFGSHNFGGSRADASAVAQTIANAGGAPAEATAAAEAIVEAARGGRATAVAEAYARASRFNRGGAARVMARSAAVAYERGDPYVQSLAQSTAEAFTVARAAGTLGDFAGAMAQAVSEGGEYGQATFGQAMAKAMATTEGQAAVAEATASVFCGPNTYATAWAEAMSVALSRDSRGCLVLNKAKAIAVARCNGGVFSAEAKAEATSRVLGFCGLGARPWGGDGGFGGGFNNNFGGFNNNNNYYADNNNNDDDDGGFRGPIGLGAGNAGPVGSLLNRIGSRLESRLGRPPFERAEAGASAEAVADGGR